MGEKPTEADEMQARHDTSMNAIGNIRAREAAGSSEATPPPGPEETPGAPLKGVDVKLGREGEAE